MQKLLVPAHLYTIHDQVDMNVLLVPEHLYIVQDQSGGSRQLHFMIAADNAFMLRLLDMLAHASYIKPYIEPYTAALFTRWIQKYFSLVDSHRCAGQTTDVLHDRLLLQSGCSQAEDGVFTAPTGGWT